MLAYVVRKIDGHMVETLADVSEPEIILNANGWTSITFKSRLGGEITVELSPDVINTIKSNT